MLLDRITETPRSQYLLQLELLHDGKGAGENEHFFKPLAAHLGLNSNVPACGVSKIYSTDCTHKIRTTNRLL